MSIKFGVPEHIRFSLVGPVELWAWSGDGPKFLRLFRDVWVRIPETDRDVIVAAWSNPPCTPKVELVSDWSRRKFGVWASVGLGGYEVRFLDAYVERATEPAIRFTIANKFAHVLERVRFGMEDYCARFPSTKARVADANAKARAWLGLMRAPGVSRSLADEILRRQVEQL